MTPKTQNWATLGCYAIILLALTTVLGKLSTTLFPPINYVIVVSWVTIQADLDCFVTPAAIVRETQFYLLVSGNSIVSGAHLPRVIVS